MMLLSSLSITAEVSQTAYMHLLARHLDPRRSIAIAVGWMVFALSLGLTLVGSVLVDRVARTNFLQQRGRQLETAADGIRTQLHLNLVHRLDSVRLLAAILATELRTGNHSTVRRSLDRLQQASPEFAWIGVADSQGRLLAATQGVMEGASVADRKWFMLGLSGLRAGEIRRVPIVTRMPTAATDAEPGAFVDVIAPVVDTKGDTIGIIGTQLRKRWLLDLAESLGQKLHGSAGTEALLLDRDGTVLIGPTRLKGKRWESGSNTNEPDDSVGRLDAQGGHDEPLARVKRSSDGKRLLIAEATPGGSEPLRALGWRVVVLEPLPDAMRGSGMLEARITFILLGLGILAALFGVLLTRRITSGLTAITRSADALRTGVAHSIAVPAGQNEAARLGRGLDELLSSLQRERSALQALNAELDQRVAARTREVERLAEQARYSAVVRERLRIARDLHDTLAHSMMAMLTEIRVLKRLSATNPEAMAEELERAEEAAHEGLKEARAAIAQMRFNPVRDEGLAVALSDFVKRFVERTGIPVDYTSDAKAGAFADERAETLFRIIEEAMSNVERHSAATKVSLSLREHPDGQGLTLTIADNGVGFDAASPHPGHYGLAGLREQAQLIGAALTIQSAPEQGTKISITLVPSPDS